MRKGEGSEATPDSGPRPCSRVAAAQAEHCWPEGAPVSATWRLDQEMSAAHGLCVPRPGHGQRAHTGGSSHAPGGLSFETVIPTIGGYRHGLPEGDMKVMADTQQSGRTKMAFV